MHTTEHDTLQAYIDGINLAASSMEQAGLDPHTEPMQPRLPIMVLLAAAYEQAQTEQDAGYMKHSPEAEAMGRGRAEGLRLAVAIVLGCDDAIAMAVLDGMDTRP